jgi:hypothetical protein
VALFTEELIPEQTIFSDHLLHARQMVQCSFGIMTNMWSILLKATEITLNWTDGIIKCMFVAYYYYWTRGGSNKNSFMYIWLPLGGNKRNAAACMYQPQVQNMARFQSLKCKVLASLYIYIYIYLEV